MAAIESIGIFLDLGFGLPFRELGSRGASTPRLELVVQLVYLVFKFLVDQKQSPFFSIFAKVLAGFTPGGAGNSSEDGK